MIAKTRAFPLLVLLMTFTGHHANYCSSNGVCEISSDSDNCNGTLLKSIAEELKNSGRKDAVINISVSSLHLNENVVFKNFDSLVIMGHPGHNTVIDCTILERKAGITFAEIKNVTLSDLNLTSCGSEVTVSASELPYISALTVKTCNNLYFTNLSILKSQGIGLTILHHREGVVNISSSVFTDNKHDDGTIRGGGGVYIGEFECNSSNKNSTVSFQFEHCNFEGNVAHTKRYDLYEFIEIRKGYGQGGGVFVALQHGMTHRNVTIVFSHCTFDANQGFGGGGLSVQMDELQGSTDSNVKRILVNVENSTFKKNGCKNNTTRIGGGAYLSLHSLSPTIVYNFHNVTFTENCAKLGGGVYFSSHWLKSGNYSLRFDTCQFTNNSAHTGSAVDLQLTPSTFIKLSGGELSDVVFVNCHFLENSVSPYNDTQRATGIGTLYSSLYNEGEHRIENNNGRATGIGTLYSSLYNVRFEGEHRFENNNGTAVYIVNGVANFSSSSAYFIGNRGIRGGAMALIGSSLMVVGPNRKYIFMNNSAFHRGGAMYVFMINSHDFTVSRSCFVQYFNGSSYGQSTQWNNNITFTDNYAREGRSIYATSLNPCQVINNGTENDPSLTLINSSKIFTSRGININIDDVATDGAKIQSTGSQKLLVIPGKRTHHGITMCDDTDKLNEAPLWMNVLPNKSTIVPDSGLTYYVGSTIQLSGEPGDNATLILETASTRQIYTKIEVELDDCPPGFTLSDNNVCVCNAEEHNGYLECNSSEFFSYLIPGAWIGLVPEINATELAIGICPHTFCNYSDTDTCRVVLPSDSEELKRRVCGPKREGVLCGNCKANHTVHFHSPQFECVLEDNMCKVGWLFYILSELVPVTVVFVTVIVFNISFTSGAVNGFILFSQMLLSLNIDTNGIVNKFSNKRDTRIREGYQFLYGLLNLEFFSTETMSFCLWPNATALHMLAFKYVTIVYALSLVILVIWFMNKCGGRCLGRWCRITSVKSSIIHGISAFFIICYSQSVSVSHALVNGVDVHFREGSNLTSSRRVWLDGNSEHFSKNHLPYALPAIFCLTTIGAVPPMILLVYPLSNRLLNFFGLGETKLVNCISRKLPVSSLIPLLDCFQSCFKDDLRFFAGLYFLYRWIAPVLHISTSLGIAYATTEFFLILILAIHAFSQPYVKRIHNMIDTLLFTDLLLIHSITCINFYLIKSRESRSKLNNAFDKTVPIQAVFIYLPFIIMAVCVFIKLCKHTILLLIYCHMKNKRVALNTSFNNFDLKAAVLSQRGKIKAGLPTARSGSPIREESDEELLERIERKSGYKWYEETDTD